MRRQPLPSSHYLARAHGQAEAFQTTLATTRPGPSNIRPTLDIMMSQLSAASYVAVWPVYHCA